jgi:hypothetical protein
MSEEEAINEAKPIDAFPEEIENKKTAKKQIEDIEAQRAEAEK